MSGARAPESTTLRMVRSCAVTDGYNAMSLGLSFGLLVIGQCSSLLLPTAIGLGGVLLIACSLAWSSYQLGKI